MADYEMNETKESTTPFPRTVDELVEEYAELNAVITKAVKRRERLDVQFNKIMEQQSRAYHAVQSGSEVNMADPTEMPIEDSPRYRY